jgi:starch phosphorylase
MKFALNGALTIGTLDGANIEIMEEIGRENIFIFGLDAQGVKELRSCGYNPREYYEQQPALKKVLDQIAEGEFSPENRDLFKPIVDDLLNQGDHYMLLADYAPYVACQEEVGKLYRDHNEWSRRAILNTAGMGKFSSDRTVAEYARDIWGVKNLAVSDAIHHCVQEGVCPVHGEE